MKIGETFYLIYREAIYKETVYMIGKESFCHENAFNEYYNNIYRNEIWYEQENTIWFKTFKEAKQKLLSEYPDCKLVKKRDGYWELELL